MGEKKKKEKSFDSHTFSFFFFNVFLKVLFIYVRERVEGQRKKQTPH